MALLDLLEGQAAALYFENFAGMFKGEAEGLAVVSAVRAGGSFAAWKKAFSALEPRTRRLRLVQTSPPGPLSLSGEGEITYATPLSHEGEGLG